MPSPSRRFAESPLRPSRAAYGPAAATQQPRGAAPRPQLGVRRLRDLGLDGDELPRARRRLDPVREFCGQAPATAAVSTARASIAPEYAQGRARSHACSSRPSSAAPRRRSRRTSGRCAGATCGTRIARAARSGRRACARWTSRTGTSAAVRGPGRSSSPAASRATSSTVFRRLWQARFPIRRLRPVSAYRGSDDASMAADNTSGFNCRFVGGTTRWSQHAYGEAIDVNPVENPYVQGARVSPPAGRALRRPHAASSGHGRRGRRARAGVRGRGLEVGGELRRLPALLDDGRLMDALRAYWDFDDLDATARRFRALRAEALTQLARVEGLRERFDEGDRLLDEAAQERRPAGPDPGRSRARAPPALERRQGGRAAALRVGVRRGAGGRRGLARGRRCPHVRARRPRLGRDARLVEARDRARRGVRSRRVLGRAAPQQPRLGVLRGRRARGRARRLRARARRAGARAGQARRDRDRALRRCQGAPRARSPGGGGVPARAGRRPVAGPRSLPARGARRGIHRARAGGRGAGAGGDRRATCGTPRASRVAACASSSTPSRRSPSSAAPPSRTTTSCSSRRTGRPSRRSRRRPTSRAAPASSSFPTSAGSTASTRSSRCASPSGAIPRSRSTTSAARPALRSVTTTSSTWSTCGRRRRPGFRRMSRRAWRTCARPATRSSRSASASAGGTRGSRRRADTGWPARSASTAAPAPARTEARVPPQRAAEFEAPILALMGGADEGIAQRGRPRLRGGARAGRRRARGRHLPRRAAQLLRPAAGGVRRRLRGRVAARARVRRAATSRPRRRAASRTARRRRTGR